MSRRLSVVRDKPDTRHLFTDDEAHALLDIYEIWGEPFVSSPMGDSLRERLGRNG